MSYLEIDRLHLHGYHLNSASARIKASNGEVMILSREWIKVKNNLNHNLDKNILEEKRFEFTRTKYKILREEIVVIGLYRSPNSDMKEFFKRLNLLLKIIIKMGRKIITAEDLNIINHLKTFLNLIICKTCEIS